MLPACIYGNKKITTSADGSIIFYSLSYEETYRAKSVGAFTESLHKFFRPSALPDKYIKRDVRILDICLGLGYNCAVTFDCLSRIQSPHRAHIVSIEKDISLPPLIDRMQIMWPSQGYQALKRCLRGQRCGGFSMELHHGDAADIIYMLGGKFDAIYFDPFSVKKNPEMWTVEMFTRLKELLADDGRLMTYASGKTARKAMADAGFIIHDIPAVAGAFLPSTVAHK